MVALPQQYNVDERDERGSGGAPLIPQGQYQAVIVNTELKQTKSGGQALVAKVVITQGQHQNVEFDEWMNIINNNDIAVKIAYDTLAEISKACNMTQTPADSSQLHNIPLFIDVKTEEGKEWTDKDGQVREGKPKSVIKKYLPLTQGAAQTAQPAQNQNAFAAPQAGNDQASTSQPATTGQSAAASAPQDNPFAAPQG